MAWSVGEAIQALQALEPFQGDFAEQPVHWTDLNGMARIRAAVPISLAVDQGCFTEHEALAVIEQRAADIITVGLHETGGILGMKKVAAVASAGGLPICRHGVMGETGITTLASGWSWTRAGWSATPGSTPTTALFTPSEARREWGSEGGRVSRRSEGLQGAQERRHSAATG